MATNDEPIGPPDHVDKGKRRAVEPSERTPLLASGSNHVEEEHVPSHHSQQQRLRSTLTTVFLGSLSATILIFCLLAILAWSYASRAAGLKPEDVIEHDLTLVGPDKVDILSISKDGELRVRVTGRVGMDVGSAIGINGISTDGFLDSMWKWFGKQGVQALDRVTVNMSTISVRPQHSPDLELLRITAPPFEIPLTVDPPNDTTWLTSTTIPVLIQPRANVTALLQYLKESWKTGSFALQANVANAVVRGGALDHKSWRSNFYSQLTQINTPLDVRIPSLPGLPHPGKNLPFPSFSQLVTLTSFNVSSNFRDVLVHAAALAVNPAPPSVASTIPALPFVVSLANEEQLSPISIVSVTTSPFPLTHPNISIEMDGKVLPLSSSSTPALSRFVTHYLSGEPNDIMIGSPLLPDVTLKAEFPAPNPRPQILRNVTIDNMKIRPTGGAFLASGTVRAKVVLPKGIRVGLDVFRVLPDVLIFDGDVPDEYTEDALSLGWGDRRKQGSNRKGKQPNGGHGDKDNDLPPEAPLPDPLPEHAFGHIRPEEWLLSTSEEVIPARGDGATYAVSADVVDAPIKVLPGRQKEFSNFVGKVIFGSEGALAGILGSAAVTVAVEGLPLQGPGRRAGEIVLSGLPFRGSVIIGKKGF